MQGVALKRSPTTEDMGRLVQQLPWYYNASTMPHIPPLVENMVKHNRSRFPIGFLLTTLICSHQIAIVKPNKQICSCLVTTDQGGQKKPNGKTTAVVFYHVFYWCTYLVLFVNVWGWWVGKNHITRCPFIAIAEEKYDARTHIGRDRDAQCING